MTKKECWGLCESEDFNYKTVCSVTLFKWSLTTSSFVPLRDTHRWPLCIWEPLTSSASAPPPPLPTPCFKIGLLINCHFISTRLEVHFVLGWNVIPAENNSGLTSEFDCNPWRFYGLCVCLFMVDQSLQHSTINKYWIKCKYSCCYNFPWQCAARLQSNIFFAYVRFVFETTSQTSTTVSCHLFYLIAE